MPLTETERTDLRTAWRTVAEAGPALDGARTIADDIVRHMAIDLHLFEDETPGRMLWLAGGYVRMLTERGYSAADIGHGFSVAALRFLEKELAQ